MMLSLPLRRKLGGESPYIGSKQERDVYYNRIQEDEMYNYIEKLKVALLFPSKNSLTIIELHAFIVKP